MLRLIFLNREEYYKLRDLPENKNLSDYDFHMKYSNKVKFKQTDRIEDMKGFKKKMRDMKSVTEKKIIEW